MADRVPDRQQDALSLVIARTILMRLAEIAESDRAVDCSNDHPDRDLGRVASHHVAAADTTFGSNQTRPFERQQDLLQVRLGQTCAFRNIAHRGRPAIVVED